MKQSKAPISTKELWQDDFQKKLQAKAEELNISVSDVLILLELEQEEQEQIELQAQREAKIHNYYTGGYNLE